MATTSEQSQNPTPSTSDSIESPHRHLSGRKRSTRHQVNVACDNCRNRKIRCDGQKPQCGPCTRRHVQCVYQTDPDISRFAALKQKIERLSGETAEYNELFHHLRARPEPEAFEILRLIRTSVDRAQVLKSIREDDLLATFSWRPLEGSEESQSPEERNAVEFVRVMSQFRNAYPSMERGVQTLSSPTSDRRMDISHLISHVEDENGALSRTSPSSSDSSRYSSSASANGVAVPPGSDSPSLHNRWSNYVLSHLQGVQLADNRWTTVTDDSELIAHLLSLYFVWEHPIITLIDRDLFLEDLVAERRRSTFCSDLLVNAILALACHFSPRSLAHLPPGSVRTMANDFLVEAKRLFDVTEKQHNLTRVQAAVILSMVSSGDGQDDDRNRYKAKAVSLAVDLGLFREEGPLRAQDCDGDEWYRACGITAWGVFNWQAYQNYTLREAPLVRKPPPFPLDQPSLQALVADSYYKPDTSYPLPEEEQALYDRCVFFSWCRFCTILVDISHIYYGGQNKGSTNPDLSNAEQLYWRLLEWTNELPDFLVRTNKYLPHALALQMLFHSVIVGLFLPFEETLGEDGPTLPEHRVTVPKTMEASMKQFALTLSQYQDRWGFHCGPIMLMQSFFVMIVSLMKFLPEPDAVHCFLETLRAMRQLGRTYWMEQVTLRTIQLLARGQGILLSREVDEILDFDHDGAARARDEGVKERMNDGVLFDSSMFGRDREGASMQTLVAEWDKLSVSTKKKFSEGDQKPET